MCEVCAIFGAGEHWSDFGRLRNERLPFDDIQHYRSERKHRIALLNLVLEPVGLSCADWNGEALSLHDLRGRFCIAETVSDVWRQVEHMTGNPIDPLNWRLSGSRTDG